MAILDYKKMRKICLAPIDYFSKYGHVVNTPDGRYFFKDNGSHILGIAHLDSVNNTDHFYKIVIDGQTVIYNAQVDDRLGAYILLELLPTIGITVDWLLTEGEEIGKSTARHFKTQKNYKWMFQFDRHGDDVVTYKYTETSFKNMLRKAGFNKWEWGAFTDICELGHLGCRGFNVGIGYEAEHSKWASADMGILVAQVAKFANFYKKYGGVHIKYDEKERAVKNYSSNWGTSYYTSPVKGPGDFSHWDGHKAWYFDAEMQPLLTFEESKALRMKEKEPWYKQADLMDSAADEGDLSGLFTCDTCNIVKSRLQESHHFSGICTKCEPDIEICVACQHPVHNSTIDEYNMCKVCHNQAEMGHGRLTSTVCQVCGCKKLSTELLKNTCYTCKNSQAGHGVLPSAIM
jgi:hypothetical protein